MARETVIKVKHRGEYVNVDDLPYIKEQEAEAAKKDFPVPDIESLPTLKDLDRDVPFEQLFYEHKDVRYYITAKGFIRMGLNPEQESIAQKILDHVKGVKTDGQVD